MTTATTPATFSWHVMRPLLAALGVIALNGVATYFGTLHAHSATMTVGIALGTAIVADLIGYLKALTTPQAEAEVHPLEAEIEAYTAAMAKAATEAAVAAIRERLPQAPSVPV